MVFPEDNLSIQDLPEQTPEERSLAMLPTNSSFYLLSSFMNGESRQKVKVKKVTFGQVAEHVPGQLVNPLVVDLSCRGQCLHPLKLSGYQQLFTRAPHTMAMVLLLIPAWQLKMARRKAVEKISH